MDLPGGTTIAPHDDADGLERRLATTEEALLEAERRYRLLASNATDMIIRADVNGQITYVSPSVGHVLGYDSRALLDTSVLDLVHPDDRARTLAAMADGPAATTDGDDDAFRFVCRSKGADGGWIWTETLSRAVRHPVSGEVVEYQNSIRDVSPIIEARDELRRTALRFQSALASSPAAVAVVDLDHRVVVVNRAMTVLAGAEAPALIGQDWRRWVDEADRPLLAQTANAGLGGRVTRPLELRFRNPDGTLRWGRVSVSPLDPEGEPSDVGPEEPGFLLQIQDVTAERRRSELVERHRGPDSISGRIKRQEIEDLITTALSAHWLRLHYQPIVDLASRRLVGHEALVRIDHPGAGLLHPATFLHRAEESDVILPLGRWILAEAIRRAGERWARGQRTYVSVNVSSPQLSQDDLASTIAEGLAAAGLPATALHIELTESIELLPDGTGRAEVARISALGCPVWLDDFGTGFSSLTYLHQLPVTGLKIDRSFVADMVEDPDAAAIVGSVVGLGQGLGLEVVAEGVENEHQARALLQLGCGAAQGYLFGRAEPDHPSDEG